VRVTSKKPAEDREPEWVRRRRLADVFGEVLPDTTADEHETTDPAGESRGDAWLEEQVPPHHGG